MLWQQWAARTQVCGVHSSPPIGARACHTYDGQCLFLPTKQTTGTCAAVIWLVPDDRHNNDNVGSVNFWHHVADATVIVVRYAIGHIASVVACCPSDEQFHAGHWLARDHRICPVCLHQHLPYLSRTTGILAFALASGTPPDPDACLTATRGWLCLLGSPTSKGVSKIVGVQVMRFNNPSCLEVSMLTMWIRRRISYMHTYIQCSAVEHNAPT
jgi:hypothetical protein